MRSPDGRGAARAAELFSGCPQVQTHSHKPTASESETVRRGSSAKKTAVNSSDGSILPLLLYKNDFHKPLRFSVEEPCPYNTNTCTNSHPFVSTGVESSSCVSAQIYYFIIDSLTFQGMQVLYFSEQIISLAKQ